jgi:hypothetical protein
MTGSAAPGVPCTTTPGLTSMRSGYGTDTSSLKYAPPATCTSSPVPALPTAMSSSHGEAAAQVAPTAGCGVA